MMNAAVDPLDYFARHARGDWGEIEPTEVADNLRAIDVGDRILSEYEVNHTRIWVITEADRSCTTILLPEEY